jgi:hypothetical protein
MNIQVGDLICSVLFPSYGKGIVLDKQENHHTTLLFIHWLQVKDTSWYNPRYMALCKLGETK